MPIARLDRLHKLGDRLLLITLGAEFTDKSKVHPEMLGKVYFLSNPTAYGIFLNHNTLS